MDKNKKKFTVLPSSITFSAQSKVHKFIIKNTSTRTQSYQVVNPNFEHYNLQNCRKFTLAPGISQICHVSHVKCQKCHKDEFNKLRITNSQKQTILVTLQCPEIIQQEIHVIEFPKQIRFKQFNYDNQQSFTIPIKNLTLNNLKLSLDLGNHGIQQNSKVEFEQHEFILLKGRQMSIKGKLSFLNGSQFDIPLLVTVVSQDNLAKVAKVQKIRLIGNALVKSQVVKNTSGKIIDSINLKVLNGTSIKGQFLLDNNFRKDCQFKIIPQISSSNPNQFSSKWIQSQIAFSQQLGQIKAFETKKIIYQIKTTPNVNDINFIEKFSKIDSNDQFNLAKMKASKYFRKKIDINVKVVFAEKQPEKSQNNSNFKIRLNIINPALKMKLRSQIGKQIFEITNQSDLPVPFQIENNTLYKSSLTKGVFENQKQTLEFQWKKGRPQTAFKSETSTFSLAYGKCDLFLKLSSCNLQIYNFVERQNLRPSTSTVKKNLGLDRNHSVMLKRPLSALCNQMTSKKLKLIREQDFYAELPKFLAIDYLKNEELQKVLVSSGQKGNIISNTWTKQISIYFPGKGHLVLKPLKAYLLPYSLNLTTLYINDQQFNLSNGFSAGLTKTVFSNSQKNQEIYTLSPRELTFTFNAGKKNYEVENSIVIKNLGKETFKAFLLTVEDQCFVSGQEQNMIVVHPNQSVSFRIKLFPTNSNRKDMRIVKKLQFLINGIKQEVTCYGELLPVECDYFPKELRFTQCHYGEEEVTQKIILSNTGFAKVMYQVYCPQYLNVNYLQNSGTIAGKGNAFIEVKFKPSTYLENYKDHIKILIRGSHAILIPVFINTLKPNIVIIENSIDFAEGILGDVVQSTITIENRNKNSAECAINLNQTELLFEDKTKQRSILLKANQKKQITLNVKINQIGVVRQRLLKPIAEIPGFGAIPSPLSLTYIGKQNILEIFPAGVHQTIIVQDVQTSFKIRLKSLIGQKVELRAVLVPQKKFDETFIMSVEPHNLEIAPYLQKQIFLNSLISDLQKLKQIERNYSLQIFRKGHPKPYTTFKLNVKLPTPKLLIEPRELYFPIIGLNNWNHLTFKIENKGYKQIHFKIKKPSNITFDLEVVPKFSSSINSNLANENKLTKLNNEAQVRVSFRSKVPVSFQNIIEIQDNFSNVYSVKIYGLATNCPLLLAETAGSMPISTKSIPSMVSMPLMRTTSSISGGTRTQCETQQHQIQHAKFLNFWIGSFMPHMKKENGFHQYLSKPETLLEFLEYFSIQIPKNGQKIRLCQIMFELRKMEIPVDIVNVDLLSKNSLLEWIKFIYILLSKRFIHPDCLKWASKISNQSIENYELAHNNYKKIITTLLNSIFFKVFQTKINQYQKIIQRFDPFLQFLFKIESKKQLIVSLNILYHKLSYGESEIVRSEELTHKLTLSHNMKYQKTTNWIISNGLPEIQSNSGGTNIRYNISECGYYFTLDKTHTDSELTIGLKQSNCIALLNSTLFEKCHFVEYELEQIQPKIHNVVIQCEDKFTQEWVLEYEAPIDSQYKIDFVGDSQFKCRFTSLGLVRTGKKIPITIVYSPNNLNSHSGTLTIMNNHFKEIYNIKGKPLFSQNIQYQRQIKICQGKKHIEIIEIPWEYHGPLSDRTTKKDKTQTKKSQKVENDQPHLSLTEYNEKRKELLSQNLTLVRQGKKQFLVKLKFEYLFDEPIKSLPLLYQIVNEDQTQSKIIRIIVKVVPKPINIEAVINCKLEQSVIQKIPLQNLSEEKQMATIEFFKSIQQAEKYDRIMAGGCQESERSDLFDIKTTSRIQNQFKLSRVGKMFLDPGQLENINLTYRPDSLFETLCQVRITYEQSQTVINYKFRGIPEFPSTVQDPIYVKCMTEERKSFKIQLKSIVRQNTIFEIQTNIKQLSGKDKIILASGQTLDYDVQVFSYHPGTLKGQLIFKSPEITLVYPIEITVQENSQSVKKYKISTRIRHPMVLQLELHNKSNENITYEVLCNHKYLTCPKKFFIEKQSKKVLQATYLPYEAGLFQTQVRLFHPDLKEIVYDLEMRSQPHEQLICGPQLQLLEPYVFVLPIKNMTPKKCNIQMPQIPEALSFKNSDLVFPLALDPNKTLRLQLLYKQKELGNILDETIVIKTDCIGQYRFRCKLDLSETKNMDNIYVHYQTSRSASTIEVPLNVQFVNGFNEKIKFNLEYKGVQKNTLLNALKLKTPNQFILQPYETFSIEGQMKINVPSKGEKTLLRIDSNEDVQAPISLVLWTMKNKIRYEFVYPIKLIRVYDNPQQIVVKANAYEVKKTLINLAVVRDVSRLSISDMTDDFVKSSFGFTSVHSHENYLETVINKPFRYEGYITFYNLKNQAQRIPLKLEIGEPKYEPIVISSNVGQKAALQIQLKNGKGPFKVQLINNKNEQFGVEPTEGTFVQTKGDSIAKINFTYFPTEYSGLKRAKVAITSEQGCYYFNLMGKFKSYKKVA